MVMVQVEMRLCRLSLKQVLKIKDKYMLDSQLEKQNLRLKEKIKELEKQIQRLIHLLQTLLNHYH